MALPDTGIYAWVEDSLGPLGDGKISSSATWTLRLIQDGAYTPSFNTDEAYSVISPSFVVASQVIVPGAFSGGLSTIPDTDFTLLAGNAVGGIALTVSGSIERLYAHWGKDNAGQLPFTPAGVTKRFINLTLRHQRVTT